MEVFSHSVFTPERKHVFPKLYRSLPGGNFGNIRTRLRRVPIGGIYALLQRFGPQFHLFGGTIRTDHVCFYGGIPRRQIRFVPHLGAKLDSAVVFKMSIRSRSHNRRRGCTHRPAQQLTPESFLARVSDRLLHAPAPASTGSENGRTAAAVVFRDK